MWTHRLHWQRLKVYTYTHQGCKWHIVICPVLPQALRALLTWPSRNCAPLRLLQPEPAQEAGISKGASKRLHWDTPSQSLVLCVLSTNNMSLLLPALLNHWSCRQASCVCFSFICHQHNGQPSSHSSIVLVGNNKNRQKGKSWFLAGCGHSEA